MTHHRRIITVSPTPSILAAFCWISTWLTLQTAIHVHAYSIRPSTIATPAGRRRGTAQWGGARVVNGNVAHRTTMRQRSFGVQSYGSLRAALRDHEYASNSTATASHPQSQSLGATEQEQTDNDTDDDDDMRLLRSLLEAMTDLESFQTQTSTENHRDGVIDHDQNDYYSSSPNNKNDNDNDNTIIHQSSDNSELSLLFPQMAAALATRTTDIDTDTIVNDASLATLPKESVGITTEIGVDAGLVDNNEGVVRARWLLVAAAALYGTNFSVVKLLGDEMPVGISTSLRFGLAALATLPWLVEGFLPKMNIKTLFQPPKPFEMAEVVDTDAEKEKDGRRFMATMFGLEIGLWNSIGYVAQAVGLETTLASKSAFICSMAVVIVPLLDRMTGKRLMPRQWVGALVALLGVAFLELGGTNFDTLLSAGGGITTGDKLSLVQPVTFGLGFWRMEQAMHRFPEEAQRMTAAQLMAIFLSSAVYGLYTLGVFDHFGAGGMGLAGLESSMASISTTYPWKEWFTDPSILFSLFWTGCITTALTIYMETLALESLSAAETTLIFSTEPLWGTAFAVAVMGEQMGMNAAVGAGLILTACIYSNLGIQGLRELWISTTKKSWTN